MEADSNSFSSRSGTPSVLRTEEVSNEAREPEHRGQGKLEQPEHVYRKIEKMQTSFSKEFRTYCTFLVATF